MSGHRAERVADVIRGALARALREEVRDPRIGFVTVTAVDLSPDLKHARVYVSTLQPGEPLESALAGLRAATPFLRRWLARDTSLRSIPRLDFRADHGIQSGSRIDELLDEIRKDPESEPGAES